MAGLGSFIDGAMVGYRFAEGADDYRQRKRRGIVNDEWLAKARSQEEKEWSRRDQVWDRNEAEYKRSQEERSVLEAIGKQARDSYDPNAAEGPNISVSTRSGDESSAPVGAPTSSVSLAPAQTGQPDAPQGTDGRPVATSPNPPRQLAPRGLGTIAPDAAPRRPDPAPVSQYQSGFEAMAVQSGLPSGMVQAAQRADIAASELAAGRNLTTGAPLMEVEKQDRQRIVSAAEVGLRRAAERERRGGPAPDFGPVPAAASRGVAAPQMPGRDRAAPPRPAATVGAPAAGAPPAAMQPPPAAGVAPVAPDAALAPRGSAPGAADVADVAAPPDEGGSPAIVLASQTAPAPSPGRGVVGSDAPVKATEAQRKKAGKTFLDHYAETAVPKIVEYYAGKGDLEKAQAFETWAKDRNTQGLLESYGKAVHSIAIGDEEAGKRYLREYYNAIDDGYELVDFDLIEPDENGAPTKAVAKLRNEETGEVFTQEFEDRADLITNGLLHVAPERMFERVYDEIKQAAEIAADQLKFERQVNLELVKAGIKLDAPITAKEIEDAKQAISEQALLSGGQNMTDEDLTRLATERVLANRAAAQQANRPPQAAPPPDWRRSSQVAP